MKELSLNILDIAQNSIAADATLVEITIIENDVMLTLTIKDNGRGMSRDFLADVTNPFSTTRTTRKVGMGLPLLKLAAEQTGGNMSISSRERTEYPDSHGTEVVAVFYKQHMDFTPLGDIISTILTLIQGNPDVDYLFAHSIGNKKIELDTVAMREVLGDVPISDASVLMWVRDMLVEQYQ